jgi:hypothetical protein
MKTETKTMILLCGTLLLIIGWFICLPDKVERCETVNMTWETDVFSELVHRDNWDAMGFEDCDMVKMNETHLKQVCWWLEEVCE